MSTEAYTDYAFNAMGTACQVRFQAASPAASSAFTKEVSEWIGAFEQRFSRFIPDSLISRINAGAGGDWIEIDDEAESLFALCDWFHWSTRGLFDPATLPVIVLWDYHSPHPAVPPPGAIASALTRCGWSKMKRRKGAVRLPESGMGIDVGGIGKEYAVDRILEKALASGIRNILVDFGHDLRVQGEPPEGGPWRVGLEDPADPGQCWAGVAVTNRAVTTSGDYFRNSTIGGERFGHIIDPRTGSPVHNGCRSVSVIAQTCTEAGILSTTAFILGGEAGLNVLDAWYQAEGCINETNNQYLTRRFHEYLIRK